MQVNQVSCQNHKSNPSFQKNLIVTFAEGAEMHCNFFTKAMDLATDVMKGDAPFPVALDIKGDVLLVTDNTTFLGRSFADLSTAISDTVAELDETRKLVDDEISRVLAPLKKLLVEATERIKGDKKTTVHVEIDSNGNVVKKGLLRNLFG